MRSISPESSWIVPCDENEDRGEGLPYEFNYHVGCDEDGPVVRFGLLFPSFELVTIVNEPRDDLLVDRVEHYRKEKAGEERAGESLNILGKEPEGNSVKESLQLKSDMKYVAHAWRPE